MRGLQQIIRQCVTNSRFQSTLPVAGRLVACAGAELPSGPPRAATCDVTSSRPRGFTAAAASSAQPPAQAVGPPQAAQAGGTPGRELDGREASSVERASSDTNEAAGPLPVVDLAGFLRACKVVPPRPVAFYKDIILNLRDDQQRLGLPLWEVYHYMLAEGVRPSSVLFEAMLQRATRALLLDDALAVLDEMASKGCAPTLNMYNRVLVLCARKKEVDKAHQAWNSLLRSGLRPSRESVRALLEVCGSTGDVRSTKEVMDWMQKTLKLPAIDMLFSHQMLIRAYVLSVPRLPEYLREMRSLWDAAKVIPGKMAESGDDTDLLENRVFRGNKLGHALEYVALEVIKGCISFKDLDLAYEIAKEAGDLLSRKGLEMETLWRLQVKAGKFDKAKQIFVDMKARNVKPSSSTVVQCAKEYLLPMDEAGMREALQLLVFLAETDKKASLGEADAAVFGGGIFRHPVGSAPFPLELMHDFGRIVFGLMMKGASRKPYTIWRFREFLQELSDAGYAVDKAFEQRVEDAFKAHPVDLSCIRLLKSEFSRLKLPQEQVVTKAKEE